MSTITVNNLQQCRRLLLFSFIHFVPTATSNSVDKLLSNRYTRSTASESGKPRILITTTQKNTSRVGFGQPGLAPADVHWRDLWTVVRLQDGRRDWHNVEGWQGTLDDFVSGEGRKVWWVAERDFGTGPFRWVLYHDPGGRRLAPSDLFHLPDASGETVTVEVMIEP